VNRAQAPFGRYELLDRISAGGMAEVFRAREPTRGTVVALKRILPQVAEDEEFIAMLKDEARICSQLEHPHIARTLDFGHVDGDYFIVFEYVDGRDLRQIFDRAISQNGVIPLPILLYVFARIGEGLSYAHHRRDASGETISLVHRDVSPQNIIVSFNGDVKLIDFGIAKARGKITRTQAGTIKGKFGYMSPEQVRGIDIDHRADIFALGVCMWEMLTLKRLFQAENELQVLDRIRNMVVPPPSETNRECPPELDRIVSRALAKDPGDRYRATKDLYRDINALPESSATRDEVAQFMRNAFPELAPLAKAPERRESSMNRTDVGTSTGGSSPSLPQESLTMAADNKGSDLDIFEGLGKKSSGRVPTTPPASGRGPVPPPPPNGDSFRAGPSAGDARKTLMGVAAPAMVPSSGAITAARPMPPPPPGRGSLPQVVPPPHRGSSGPPMPPPVSTRPQVQGKSVDMEWDDENENTHVFDKSESKVAAAAPVDARLVDAPPPSNRPSIRGGARTLAGPANGVALAPPPPPPPPPSAGVRAAAPASQPPFRAATAASGMGPGSQPAFRSSAPPPPPGGGAFARTAASAPPFGTTTPMGMPGMPQQTTAPLPMARSPMSSRPHATPLSSQPVPSMEATALVRPQPPGRTSVWIALGVAFTAIVAASVFFLTAPRTGRVLVNVNDPRGQPIDKVEIFLDGKKWCDTTPCTIDPVPSGAHEVKVLADGYEVPQARPISVEPRKEAQLSFALAPSALRSGTGIKVSGYQTGVKLYIDDREIGPIPAEVRDLSPGNHRVRIMGSERYASYEKNVTVAKDEMLDLGTVPLKVLKGKITVTLSTTGAKVYIVSGSDRRELPILPISVDIDTSKTWQLEATKLGYADYRKPIGFDDGQAEKTFDVTLDPRLGGPPFTAAPPPAPEPRPVSRPAPAPVARAPVAEKADKAEEGAAAGGGESLLDINSIPVSNVILDGKPIGTTPRLHVNVSPGSHTVQFVNAEQGLKKTITVKVGAGETARAIAKLKGE
jgi:serine/threonine protein kinase